MEISGSCRQCGLPFSSKKVTRAQNGRCSFCVTFGHRKDELSNYQKYRKYFTERMNGAKNRHSYDALVGISGGKDGAYVLHQLVRKYKLRVLTCTIDNGFITKKALKNTLELARLYNVDHVYYRPENLRPLYVGILKKLGVPCYACAMAGYYFILKMLRQLNIPFFVHGRSPFQMYRNLDEKSWKKDVFVAMMKTNLLPYDPIHIKKAYKQAYIEINNLVQSLEIALKDKDAIMEEFFNHLRSENSFVPEAYAYFLTEKYDETKIRQTLEKAGYSAPRSHSDCKIHNVAEVTSSFPDGISTSILENAAMKRNGLNVKERTLAIRNAIRNYPKNIKREAMQLTKILEISNSEIPNFNKICSEMPNEKS